MLGDSDPILRIFLHYSLGEGTSLVLHRLTEDPNGSKWSCSRTSIEADKAPALPEEICAICPFRDAR